MNLYKYHSDPIGLVGYIDAHNIVPDIILDKLNKHPHTNLNKIQIQTLASTAESAWSYAKHYLGGRFPAGEATIADDPVYAYLYAKYIIRGRWPPGEAAIATHAEKSYFYANDVLGARFPAGEAAIAESPSYAFFYALDVIKERWPPGEKAIKTRYYDWLKYQDMIAANKRKAP